MPTNHLHPYRTPGEIRQLVDRFHPESSPLVHPQKVLQDLRGERATLGRFNGWLADHIVGIAGTMGFFYFLCLLMGGWAFWQSSALANKGFDPFPYAFLFFVLGGIMQSLFVPTMLTASNRSTLRDRIKDEADHRAWSHLYDVNDEQLRILRQLAAHLVEEEASQGAVGEGAP
ncbi:MAG: DUF1003 domain-containing protein [Chloroflexota bacterium]